MNNNNVIKQVAIYLRKSRDDGDYEDVLSKHRDALVAIANAKGWKYKCYEEVMSGERLIYRAEMQKLLKCLDENLYDAVLVIDIDRLGRGEPKDWGVIKDTFLTSDTLIITPNSTYDLWDEKDDMTFDFKTMLAKYELKKIKERFRNGKIGGAKKGMWTNGSPPYPYIYNREDKKLDVHPEKYRIYRLMMEKYLGGFNLLQIADWLNEEKIPTPYGGKRNKHGWSSVGIRRLLINEIHLGYIIYGRTRNYRGNFQIINKDEWIKVQGDHQPVKTQEEHEAILAKLAENTLQPNRSKAINVAPLSGLLFCSKCGNRMRIKRRKQNGEFVWSTMCVHVNEDGSTCEQTGRRLDDEFNEAIYKRITKIDQESVQTVNEETMRLQEARALLQSKNDELSKTLKAIEKLIELYEEEMVTKQQFSQRKVAHENSIIKIKRDIEKYQIIIAGSKAGVTVEKIEDRIGKFKSVWEKTANNAQRNKAYRSIVHKIIYDRGEDGKVILRVFYK